MSASLPAELIAFAFLAAGMLGGFVSSTPLGPINLWIVERRLHGSSHGLVSFVGGVIVADVSAAAVAAWGYAQLLADIDAGQRRLLGMALGVLLIAMGVINWLRLAPREVPAQASQRRHRAGYFGLGLLMCGLNPAFVAFWVWVLSVLGHYFGWGLDWTRTALFLCGVVCGDALWFSLLSWLTQRGRGLLHPQLIKNLRRVIAVVFVIFGAVSFFLPL